MERIQKHAFEVWEKTVSLGYKLELEGRENLGLINQKSKDPCVLYFNHATWDDMFLVINILQKESPKSLENVVLPVSEHHTHFKTYPVYAISVKAARMQGFTVPEIVAR